ncbi:Asp-tRNA(Asn)/Glu-tRNA(Gln) amidotransferase subunit GatA [Rickettsiales bacterium]|nr:Asp-tRNA(Asn)/Glu-tRNA(Gln) amidotransferase subunit GatA [Rickettsiales bacterium]
MSETRSLTIRQILDGLAAKKFSSVELTQDYLKEIQAQKDLNAFVTVTSDLALDMAAKSDKKRAGGDIGLLEGVPLAIKDIFCNKGVLTTACSNILSGFTPTYESTVTANLFAQGAVMLGKTNMDEFAMGSANSNSFYGQAKNPYKRKDGTEVVPGGSSGGSAAAVAAKLCAGSLGTDTGGSVRQPASFTGTVGVKPTYGRCSRWGIIAFASSLDQAGAFAHNVEDAALILESICGYDAKDSTSANIENPKFSDAIGSDVKGMKIGIPKEYHKDGMSKEIEDLWQQGRKWLEEAGAQIVDISLPHTKYALPTYYIIAPAEASSNLARYDGVRYGLRVQPEGCSLDEMYELTRQEGFGDEVKRRIMMGTYVLSAGYYDAYYKKAQSVRTLIARDFSEAFKNVDAILTPTAPTAAFAAGEKMDPVTTYLNDIFTVPASLAGLPGISVPAGISSDGLPLGLQIIGKAFDEVTMFKVADKIEKSAGFSCNP